nr:retrovirus-related Pol polyprotein from transposon TNT 1-94 [Tanacetum cinerariifolium]
MSWLDAYDEPIGDLDIIEDKVDNPSPQSTPQVLPSFETQYPPTTVEEKLARKNELKARGTLLMALPNEHQLKFNSYKNAKSLMEAIEKRFRVNTSHGVFAASSKTNASNLPNVDSLSDRLKVADGNVDYESQKTTTENTKESRGHFAKECKATKHQDNMNREAPKRTVPIEDTTSNALVSQCDGLGYDWSDQDKDGPTNFAIMAYTASSSSSSDTEFNLGAYKAGLKSVETRLEVYKKNETVFTDDIKILKFDVMLRDKAIIELRQKFEKAKKERDDLKLTLEKFQDSSKNLNRLLDSQQSDKSKTGLGYDSQGFDSSVLENQVNEKSNTGEGYHAVPPPYTRNFMPPKPDLVFADKHVVSESVSDSQNEDEIETKTKQIKPSFAKVKFVQSTEHVKSPRKSVKKEKNNRQIKNPRKNSQSPRVLTNSGLKTLNTDWQTSSRAAILVNTARPINTAYPRTTMTGAKTSSNVFNKTHSPVRRNFNQRTTPKNNDLKENVNTVKGKVTTVGTKAVVSVVQRNGENGNPEYTLHDHVIFDSGCSRHMTGNKFFLTDYQEFNGGFVAFGGSPKGDHLGKFEGKADEGFLVGYSVNRRGPEWLFDIDYNILNYEPVTRGNQTNHDAGKGDECVSKGSGIDDQERTDSNTQDANTIGPSINTANTNINTGSLNINTIGFNDPSVSSLEETRIFDDVYDDREVGVEADTNNLELSTVVWTLVDLPKRKRAIGTKWVFRIKKDKRGIVIGNKTRPMAQGYTQEEGIDYDEVFAPVARLEAIRLFLAYASFMGFIMYQMDVKSAFLYGTIEEKVYVCQPLGFEDPYFSDKVYKVEKLYMVYIKLLEPVHVYVDDIIFGSTKKFLCDEFEQMMHKRFQMSFMVEFTFFLGLQVKQKDDRIFINQDKYVADILKKFDFTTVKTTSTLIDPNKALIKDE